MASNQDSGSVREKVVTLQSLQIPLEAREAAAPAAAQKPENQLKLARYNQIMERLRQETADTGAGILVTVPDREVSLLQSEMARRAAAEKRLAAGGLEVKFGTGLGGGDWFGWILSLVDHVDRQQAHPMVRPKTFAADAIPDVCSIAMAADWGTGLYGAPKIAEQMKKVGGYELLMHLGDVYYSGTKEEVQERFLDLWPLQAGKKTRALNSNHEMYSGGFAYYDLALPKIGQDGSYFAFQNTNWLLVGLDTAYVDHDMDTEQVAWLNLVIRDSQNTNPARKIVLFSHQQLFSRLDNQGPKLQQALRHLLESQTITAWYWGHEHQCVVYDRHPQYGLLGRCLGNGGIPEVRKSEVKDAPTERAVGTIMWKRMTQTADSPSCLVLDGPNNDIKGEEQKFVPHGFMTLELNGPTLTERVLLSDGTELYRNQIA